MAQEQHYLLPVEAVIATMQDWPEVVSLSATVHIREAGTEPCDLEIEVDAGALLSCFIMLASGQIWRTGQEAFQMIQRMGALPWTVRTGDQRGQKNASHVIQRSAPPAASPLFSDAYPVPYRCMASPPASLDPLSRRVYALIDGKRNVYQIAHLLARTPEQIQNIILNLQYQQLIAFS